MNVASTNAVPLLSVKDLVVDFKTRAGNARVLDHVSLDIHPGKILKFLALLESLAAESP